MHLVLLHDFPDWIMLDKVSEIYYQSPNGVLFYIIAIAEATLIIVIIDGFLNAAFTLNYWKP